MAPTGYGGTRAGKSANMIVPAGLRYAIITSHMQNLIRMCCNTRAFLQRFLLILTHSWGAEGKILLHRQCR